MKPSRSLPIVPGVAALTLVHHVGLNSLNLERLPNVEGAPSNRNPMFAAHIVNP
jgi:hypothetical protein